MSSQNASIETVLLTVTLQLIVIVAAARIFGRLLQRLGQPKVCGEMAAGLILGPSLLGGLFPGVFAKIFDLTAPALRRTLPGRSQTGLPQLFLRASHGTRIELYNSGVWNAVTS